MSLHDAGDKQEATIWGTIFFAVLGLVVLFCAINFIQSTLNSALSPDSDKSPHTTTDQTHKPPQN